MKKTKWIASFVAGFVVLCMLFASCSQPSGGSPNGAGITNDGSDGSGSSNGGDGSSSGGNSGSSTPTKSDIVNGGTPYNVTIDGQNCSFTFAEGIIYSMFGDGTVTIGTKTKSFDWWVSGSTVRVTIRGSEEFELTYSESSSGTKTLSNPKSSDRCGILEASHTWDEDTKTITFTGPGKVSSMWKPGYVVRNVEKVIIEAGVTSICDGAFNGCGNLFDVIINATTPPPLHSNSTFSGCARSLTIQVPAECVEAYKTADGWSNYADKIIDNTLGALQRISVVPEMVTIYFHDGSTTNTDVARMIERAIEVTAHYENGDKLVGSADYYSVYVRSRTEASITYKDITKTIGLKAIPKPSAGITWDESTKTITFSADVKDIRVQWGDTQTHKKQVKKIIIENGVKSIGDSAFAGCELLECVEIPDSVTSIGYSTFDGCTSLASVEIPNSVTSIGGRTFYGCTSLTSVDIPSGVTSIGDFTFYGCTSLTSVDIPSSVTSIGDYTFYGCTSLTSVDIPSGVTSIGKRAFYECSKLTTVTSLDSVETIGERAFYKCSKLSSVTIGNSIKEIRECAFYICGFESLTIKASEPPRLLYDSFTNKDYFFPTVMNTIYVPADSVEIYKNAWVDFGYYANNIKAIPSN